MDTLFPQGSPEECRVCNEDVVDGRWSYCSERCRDIAEAVQKKFIWPVVREQVLERDDYTCQECGLSKGRWWRAYHQVSERVDERNPYDARENYNEWYDEDQRLTDRYDVESPSGGGFHVDHIERIADGGHKYDETNLRTLCKFCHHKKTAEENSVREPAPDVTLQDYIDA